MFVISCLRGRKFNKKMALLKRNRLKKIWKRALFIFILILRGILWGDCWFWEIRVACKWLCRSGV